MHLKLLDPQKILDLIANERDIITDAARNRDAFYDSQTCPVCGGNAFEKVADGRTLFSSDSLVARYLLKCVNCDCLFDPHSGVQLTIGNAAKAFKSSIPIIDSENT